MSTKVPGHSVGSKDCYRLEDYEDLTEQQKRIMASPSVGSRPFAIEDNV